MEGFVELQTWVGAGGRVREGEVIATSSRDILECVSKGTEMVNISARARWPVPKLNSPKQKTDEGYTCGD